ncbi:penicillin-insensitive murein endopeptidase [Rodentibacter caecimuris]|uniref:penicillin-insensitive murein endopeptidase n=1 Tax=Rodentibacter caecimuris TaxID=1796644 RepID=UPI001094E786|nr:MULTISPECIES: penicillin-insensitive murein endopeptidase [Pasteurellaceae]MCQ9122470.1 penicillin-insensitive murein endopeptidase [Rodentibacter heylii]MCR1836350.1 penicillin-insensitive murein endopeptidase [Pasteurella caecimuris]MCU0105899.1 penicillin-insensitive murein endopeptidase [Pasteurella caecimuris]MCX2962168.1 penicillin-insensitive murein endopeptidase [Rodentibacter heylii]QIA78098.1 penicillin-insensitive murein endopeptidase [Rodentibacter heylii]
MNKIILKTAVVLTALFSLSVQASPQDWQKIKRPIPSESGNAQPIGSYSNGCIIGAKALPAKGDGYQVIRMNRNRYYGHPEMIHYLKRLGERVKAAGLPTMLVGDIAMPGGGRFLTGHASHQMGLDADIWLRMGDMSDVDALNSDGKGLLVVDRKAQRVDERIWHNNHATLIKLAAQDHSVTRIFVNPAIKLKLCQTASNDRGWLHKIRPWFGHDSHFHVRLKCPADAAYCENQSPVPAGDGCGDELYSWFEPVKPNTGASKLKVIPPEPFLCQQVLNSPNRSEWLE